MNGCVWSVGGMILSGETEVLGNKPVPLQLCPPQILHILAWLWTWASTVTGKQLTAEPWYGCPTKSYF